jgi:hypothetical protein
MKADEYGAAIERVLRDATEPLTASEITAQVGCSRQRVYTWLQANEARLRRTGKDRAGGALYAWAGTTHTSIPMSDTPTMSVKSFFVDDGEIVIVLVGPDGSTYHARPAT